MSKSAKIFLAQLNLDKCPICFQLYNTTDHEPHLVCIRQHNICKTCFQRKINSCPLCRVEIPKVDYSNPNKYYKAFLHYDLSQKAGTQQQQIQLNVIAQKAEQFKKQLKEDPRKHKAIESIEKSIEQKRQTLKEELENQIKTQRRKLQQIEEKGEIPQHPNKKQVKIQNPKYRSGTCGKKLAKKYQICNFCKASHV